jgi:hypothetical protein
LCFASVLGIWIAYIPVTNEIATTIQSAQTTLEETEQILRITDTALNTASGPLEALSDFGLLEGLFPGFGEGSDGLRGDMEEIQQDLTQARKDVATAIKILEWLRPSVPTLLFISSLGMTFFFLWIAFAQISLFIHGWTFFTGKDLLVRWRK